MDNFNLKKFLRDQYLAEAENVDENKGKKISYDAVMAVANFIQDITLEMDTLDVLDKIKDIAANDGDFRFRSLRKVDSDAIVALSKSFLNYLNQKGAEAGRVGDDYVDEWLDIVTKGKNKITKGDIEEGNINEKMDSGTDVDTMTDVGTYVVDTLNDFLDPGKTITFEVEYNDDMSISVMHGIDAQRIRENDDVQAKVNDASKVKSKGGAEKKQARKGYGDKPNKSGRGKEMKRRMNKRNRKDAKQALKDA